MDETWRPLDEKLFALLKQLTDGTLNVSTD